MWSCFPPFAVVVLPGGDSRLSDVPAERMLQLLDVLYGPDCEGQWVHYAAHLMTSLAQYVPPVQLVVACSVHVSLCSGMNAVEADVSPVVKFT